MGHSINIKLMKHQHHIRLEHTDKSAVAKHNINPGHKIQHHNTCILAKNYIISVIRKVTEIEFHPAI
jgi:hypothetical protein